VVKISVSEDPKGTTCFLKAGYGIGGYAASNNDTPRFAGAMCGIVSWFRVDRQEKA
jgi:hypothetical protein